jgi:hypothetical protein
MARMQQEQNAPRSGIVKRYMGILKNSPDYSAAARSGDPTMTPASESGDETIGFSLQPNVPAVAGSSIGSTAAVETITPGSANALPAPAAATPAASDSSSGAAATDTSATQPATTTAPAANSSQESSSKKKGGLRKLIPF